MLSIDQIYLAIAFVILVGPFAFYRFTQLQNPDDDYVSGFMKFLRGILFLLSLPVYFGLCVFTTSFFYLQSYPESTVLGWKNAEWSEFMQSGAPEYFGIFAVAGMLIFIFSLIVFGSIAARRWEAKVWEDPGTATSKMLRAVAYFMHVFLMPILLIVTIGLLLYFLQERFMDNLKAIPNWIELFLAREAGDDNQQLLLGFIVVVALVALFVLWNLFGVIRSLISAFWPRVDAQIVKSELYERTTGAGRYRSTIYRFLLEYAYTVDGIVYTGTRLSYASQWLYENKPYIWGLTKRYPLLGKVQAYVNPNKPEDAVLQAGIDLFGTLNLLLHAALALILAILFLIPTK